MKGVRTGGNETVNSNIGGINMNVNNCEIYGKVPRKDLCFCASSLDRLCKILSLEFI
jgi:hypothetical protein